VRLDIAYDGTAFQGWSSQPHLRTVQGVLEAALAILFSRSDPTPTLTVAGRTDAGVHALGQVAHVDLDDEQLAVLRRRRSGIVEQDLAAALGRRLNGLAGVESDVWVTAATVAPAGFDARFSALWRRYEYRIADRKVLRNPLERHRTLWYHSDLDVARMDAAAASLIGLHDWAAYCKPKEGATTIRALQDFRWVRQDDGVLIASVEADAFCHNMVRSLVGACVAVGENKLEASELLVARDELVRTSDFNVVPAKGLTLTKVGYPGDAGMAARAFLTRRRRAVS
jgi:tRNA pseudouridine38-40 synthase